MMDDATRHVLAMLVRVVLIGAIIAGFYLTIGLGGTAQLLCIGASAAFGSQAGAYAVRATGNDPRARPIVIAFLALLAIGAGVAAVILANQS